jgi:TonB-linked SusC/RagA family outer membrane protein
MKKNQLYPHLGVRVSKTVLIMKLTFLLSTIVLLNATASVYSQKTLLSLNANNIEVEKVLEMINEQSDFTFLYRSDLIRGHSVENIAVEGVTVEQILDKILPSCGFDYEVFDKTVIIRKSATDFTSEIKQEQLITGQVTDTDGDPLPGVNVLIKGTTIGSITDVSGKYTIDAQGVENPILIFSYIGYLSEEIAVANQNQVSVSLEEDYMNLEEIVVVGYGTQRKSDITGAVGIADVDEMLKAPIFNPLQGMKGKVAGVNIFTNSGSPTSSPRVIIRGITTINSDYSPLYVVDGVVVDDIKYINPNDIERIEVLKDASSSAIYGTRGSNGVILVTTKGGLDSKGIKVGYNGFVSFGKLRNKMDVMNADEFMEVLRTGYENAPKYKTYETGDEPVLDLSDSRLFNPDGTPIYDTDWQEEATRTAISHNHQLSIQQGGEKSSLGAFINYADMEGIMLNSWMKRLSARISYDVDATDWLSLSVKLNSSRITENEVEEGGGHQMPRRSMIEMIPILPVKFPDGSWSSYLDAAGSLPLEGMANPVHVLKTQDKLRYRTRNMANFAATFHLLPGLDLRSQFGATSNIEERREYFPTDLQNISFPSGRAYIEDSEAIYWQEETYLTYNKVMSEQRINLVLGTSWSEREYVGNSMQRSGYSDDVSKFYNIDGGSTQDYSNSGHDRWAINSYFLRGSYAIKDKYLATVTGRIDGSSRFGDNNKYAFFPSIGLGWVVSDESFLSGISFINYLKLRTSYGITGNTAFSTYQSLGTVSTSTQIFNNQEAGISYITRLPNKDLQWEKTSQFNIGFNANMLNHRIALEMDYYHKYTEDLLLQRPVPQSSGYSSVWDNIGSVSNSGIDFLLTTQNINKSDFTWETTLNVNYNKNKIEALGENDEDITMRWWVGGHQNILRVGESLSSFYGYERYGCYSTQEAAENPDIVAGTAKRSDEKKIIGNGIPVWTGSFINTFYYKNFDLTVDLQFVYDVDVLQQFYHSTEDRSGIANGLASILYDSWTEDNQGAMVQQIRHQALSGQNSSIDTRWVADGSFLRGNLLALGYTFDTKLANKIALAGYASMPTSLMHFYSTPMNSRVTIPKVLRRMIMNGDKV